MYAHVFIYRRRRSSLVSFIYTRYTYNRSIPLLFPSAHSDSWSRKNSIHLKIHRSNSIGWQDTREIPASLTFSIPLAPSFIPPSVKNTRQTNSGKNIIRFINLFVVCTYIFPKLASVIWFILILIFYLYYFLFIYFHFFFSPPAPLIYLTDTFVLSFFRSGKQSFAPPLHPSSSRPRAFEGEAARGLYDRPTTNWYSL